MTRLGGLHTCMSFLGSTGQLMASTGLQTIITTVYSGHTVPHMLSGKAINQATRGHLLIYGVLYGIIVCDIYNCPILIEDSASDRNGEPLLDCSVSASLNMLSDPISQQLVTTCTQSQHTCISNQCMNLKQPIQMYIENSFMVSMLSVEVTDSGVEVTDSGVEVTDSGVEVTDSGVEVTDSGVDFHLI